MGRKKSQGKIVNNLIGTILASINPATIAEEPLRVRLSVLRVLKTFRVPVSASDVQLKAHNAALKAL